MKAPQEFRLGIRENNSVDIYIYIKVLLDFLGAAFQLIFLPIENFKQ